MIKPFDPNLTGKYNYGRRLHIMKQANPNETEHVELPKSLKTNATRNYSPKTSHLEGFAQMPRQFASPYQNGKLVLKQDLVRRKRSQHTSKFFETAAQSLGAP